MKNIYLITRDDLSNSFDEAIGFVVIAGNEQDARDICTIETKIGGYKWWLNTETSTLTTVGYTGEQPDQVVLGEYDWV